MTDYGHDLIFGTFVTPTARNASDVVDLAVLADRSGIDLVTFQDHPYQSSFLDTSTLLAFVAARTRNIRVAANVANLPLRPPAVLARASASLDVLSGGRFELGLGAGAFWNAIEAVGGRRLTPGQGVTALREAIEIIRAIWDTDARGDVRHDGEFYRTDGAKRGPRPAHPISIWVGAYKPKMLALTGTHGDGWMPAIPNLPNGAASYPDHNARIDEAAVAAGRSPSAIRRFGVLIGGGFGGTPRGLLDGPVEMWTEQLAGLALEHGVSGFVVATDDPSTTQRYGLEVVPAVRELVARERG
ncbi:LLM class flavin-dependent oxidoreductase [Umezawaea endophytica]|uniref:LLM class flavin-dependent oxidoreductase n=1 Tax=Umezawaea endophytica TaxID=1654476 RepID=A0A9X2VLM1_9PSEU|nr:LLM class flavin-dependent oxidoreductase [Umezawaea endophytica]MCS7478699.1 LLM class flavin-dependent oxidoreductase [Umezawaea endophytica]